MQGRGGGRELLCLCLLNHIYPLNFWSQPVSPSRALIDKRTDHDSLLLWSPLEERFEFDLRFFGLFVSFFLSFRFFTFFP